MTDPAENIDAPTILLDGRGAPVDLVGGKAAMVDRLVALGAPVPCSGAVTTAAYRRFVTGSSVLTGVLEQLATEPVPTLADRERARRAVDEAFLATPIPDDIADAIVELSDHVGRGRPVAVRSSATAEDLQRLSFAGQYRTLLSVERDQLFDAVRRCWASLWHPTPRLYREFRGVDEVDLAMAVLIMPMIEASHAGVLFTEDPGRPEAIRIEFVEGLGDVLVSGAQTPDVVVVDRDALDAFEPEPAALRDLAEISVAVERDIGVALDIEWAVENGAVSLLQARPITTATQKTDLDDGFDIGMGEEVRSTTAGIAEMLPGIQTPRLWAANSWLVEEAFRGLFDDLGADLEGLDRSHALVGRFRGRVAVNLDLMERIVDSVPGGSSVELEHQYFGEALEPTAAPSRPPTSSSGLLQGVRILRGRGRAFRESELVIQAIDRVLEVEPNLPDLSSRALLALRRRLLHLACRTMEAEMSVAATAAASYRGLEMFLREHLDESEAAIALERLTTPDRAAHRGRRALFIEDLATRLREEGDLADVDTADSWPEARAMLEESETGRIFVADLQARLRRAGSASVFGGDTWASLPELVWSMLSADAPEVVDRHQQRTETLVELERRIRDDRRWRLLRALTGQVVDVRRRFLRREANDAAVYLERREQTKASLLMLGGVLWRIDCELGQRLAASDQLETPDDIELTTGAEIEQMVDGETLSPGLLAFRRRRRAAAEMESPLPRVFRGEPTVATPRPTTDGLMTGWSGSPGRYEGPARVVERPERSALRRGEVLVARTTDSSWLPLFQIAGAVVVEEGGPLSHAAILARELGMPSVINVPGIVDQVAGVPGALLTVDGTTGEVGIHRGGRAEQEVDMANGVGVIRRQPSLNDSEPGRLSVFITGLIGAGAVMSVAIGLLQTIGSARTQRRISQRAQPRAEALAAGVVHGFEPRLVGAAGLRPRGYFAWLSVVGMALAVLLVWMGDDYIENPSGGGAVWQLALGLTSATTVAGFAIISLVAAVRWPQVSWVARWASLPRVHDRLSPAQLIGPVPAALVGSLLFTVLCLSWLVAEAGMQLQTVDQWLYDAIGAGTTEQLTPSVIDQVLRPGVMVPLAVVLTAATYRCRALLLTYPMVIAAGGALHLGIAHFISRDRPPAGPKPGFSDSFPGGHVNELTIMLGLLPVVLFVLTRRRWVGVAFAVVCWSLLLVMLIDAFRTGDHWPTDNIAGLMIGLSMVTIAHGVALTPALHVRCRDCPTLLAAQVRAGGSLRPAAPR